MPRSVSTLPVQESLFTKYDIKQMNGKNTWFYITRLRIKWQEARRRRKSWADPSSFPINGFQQEPTRRKWGRTGGKVCGFGV
jgi:hypothetical protein